MNDGQREALSQAIEKGPTPYLDGIVRWRLCDLVQWIWEEFRVSVREQTLSREVRAMGYRKLSARPKHHAQDANAIEALKKFPAAVAEIANGPAKGKVIEVWFEDEARIGQKNKITRRWAKRGSRPSAPHDQRTQSAYIFGAICPARGKATALVMPWCDTHAMNQLLIEMSRNVAADARAILIMDQAGWHMSTKLVVPENITILPLPPKSPELNRFRTSSLLFRPLQHRDFVKSGTAHSPPNSKIWHDTCNLAWDERFFYFKFADETLTDVVQGGQ